MSKCSCVKVLIYKTLFSQNMKHHSTVKKKITLDYYLIQLNGWISYCRPSFSQVKFSNINHKYNIFSLIVFSLNTSILVNIDQKQTGLGSNLSIGSQSLINNDNKEYKPNRT